MSTDTTHPSVTRLTEALALLPSTPEAIAEYLYVKGCYGDSGFYTCPLALWLNQVLHKEVYVGREVAATEDKDPRQRNVVLPDHISQFVKRHDNHEFPFLLPDEVPWETDE